MLKCGIRVLARKNGLVAHLVEHCIRIAGVRGPNPLESTT